MRRNTILDFIHKNTFAYVGGEHKIMIEAKAAEIMQTGVKFKDACHVASAIYAGNTFNPFCNPLQPLKTYYFPLYIAINFSYIVKNYYI